MRDRHARSWSHQFAKGPCTPSAGLSVQAYARKRASAGCSYDSVRVMILSTLRSAMKMFLALASLFLLPSSCLLPPIDPHIYPADTRSEAQETEQTGFAQLARTALARAVCR